MPRSKRKALGLPDFDYDREYRVLGERLGRAMPRLAPILRHNGRPKTAAALQIAIRMCEYDPALSTALASRALRAFAWALGTYAVQGYAVPIGNLLTVRLEYDLTDFRAPATDWRLRWGAAFPAKSRAREVLGAFLLEPDGDPIPPDYPWHRLLPEQPLNPSRTYTAKVTHGRYRYVHTYTAKLRRKHGR